jgi:hypothetical protein
MDSNLRDQILGSRPKLYALDVPEWGCVVYLRPITLAEQGRLADLGTKFEKAGLLERIRRVTMPLIVSVVCDETGTPIFTNADIEALMEKSAGSANRLQDEILKISGLTADSRAELEKNLPSAESAGPSFS